MNAKKRVLTLNSGSSSLKYALFFGEIVVSRGALDRSTGPTKSDNVAEINTIFDRLEQCGELSIDAVGHRLVHGGPRYFRPTIVDDSVRALLEAAVPFAPLHLPSELKAIDLVRARFKDLPQVACFDTGFHRTMPEVAQRFALPEHFFAEGIRRYGFHGLSYEYIVQAIGALNLQRAIIAHLGSGSSLAATRDGKPMDTTMAFSPTAGLIMATRSGDIDPGLLIYLMSKGYDARRLEHLLNHESGLLAISQTTADVKTLLEHRGQDSRAKLAIDAFCYSVRRGIGAMAAALGGIDSLVFTGGVGANATELRRMICDELSYLGVQLDDARNTANLRVISRDGSPCTVRALVTNEEEMVARGTRIALDWAEN